MGLIRKTLSISTLGLVGWRSKKELLQEAQADLEATRAELDKTTRRQSKLLEKLAEAEQQAAKAELDAISGARKARRRGYLKAKRGSHDGRSLIDSVRDTVEPVLEDTKRGGRRLVSDIEPAIDEARGRGRRARKTAEKRAKAARKAAEKRAGDVRSRALKGRSKAGAALEDATTSVKKTASDLASR